MTLTPATTGASSSTRVSLTTIAVATTAAPAGLAAATTWPTSCTLAPVQTPNCMPLEPERAAQQRERHQRDGAEQGDHRDGGGDVLLVGAGGLLHGGDGRRAADGDAGAEEQASRSAQPHPAAQPGGEHQRADQA